MIGGLCLYRFYFRIHTGSIKGPQVIEFLRYLQRHIKGKLTVVWDGAPIHRSRLVQDYAASTGGRILLERLPAYAPELNPVEYMWGNLKQHQIGNLIATQAWELSFAATAALRRMRRRRSTSGSPLPLRREILRGTRGSLRRHRHGLPRGQ
jgi:transposase